MTRAERLQTINRILWPLLLGLAAGGFLLRLSEGAFWLAVLAFFAAAVAARIVAQFNPALSASLPPDDPVTSLLAAPLRVFEALPDLVMLLDENGRVLFANRAMRAGLPGAVPGRHVSALLRSPAVLEAIAAATESGASMATEFVLPVPVERHFEAHAVRVIDAPPVAMLILHDLTAIRRSERMRADFVANASHELRTPLAAVSGFIDTLKGHARDDAEARETFLDIMATEAARMRRLIEDLLSLTRIEMNEHVPPTERVSLADVVRQAAAAIVPLAAASNVTVGIDAPGDLPPVIGAPDELVQLFQNLIHNAIKYGRAGGHVWVSLKETQANAGRGPESVIAASVRDDGEGIPAQAVPRLTERFYRVDAKRSREQGGTGLGLAIVKHIASRHQGRLTIESELGKGSNFTVLIPVARMIAPGETPVSRASSGNVMEML